MLNELLYSSIRLWLICQHSLVVSQPCAMLLHSEVGFGYISHFMPYLLKNMFDFLRRYTAVLTFWANLKDCCFLLKRGSYCHSFTHHCNQLYMGILMLILFYKRLNLQCLYFECHHRYYEAAPTLDSLASAFLALEVFSSLSSFSASSSSSDTAWQVQTHNSPSAKLVTSRDSEWFSYGKDLWSAKQRTEGKWESHM